MHVKNIDGFYYGWIDPANCFKRFDWSQANFKLILKPRAEFKELLNGMFIPNYGNTEYVPQVPENNLFEFRDPVENYY